MYSYNFEGLDKLITALIRHNLPNDTFQWLKEKSSFANEDHAFMQFKVAFSMVSRKVAKDTVQIDESLKKEIQGLIAGFHITGWPFQQLCRAWLIMQINPARKAVYIQKIEDLFAHAEMKELTALYAALPVLAYPEQWRLRCAEGIRSNIGSVLDAIMLNNPYPSFYLDEKAWNQLILKAFFTDKDIMHIIGIEKRANKSLAIALQDYADERQSAHRPVSDQIWKLTGVDEKPHKEQSKK